MLFFIYDSLMLGQIQKTLRIDLEFVCFAKASAKMYWLNDSKCKRLFFIPNQGVSTKNVYGALFLLKDYETAKHKLHSFYNNSIPYTGETMCEDLYELTQISIIPIKFNSLSDFEQNKVVTGTSTKCYSFMGNPVNKQVQNSINKKRYYRTKSIDRDSFVGLIKEKRR